MATETKQVDQETKVMEDVGGLDDESNETLKLIAGDNLVVEVSRKAALKSNVVKVALDSDAEAKEVPIPGVNGDILKLIAQYMEHYKDSEPEEPDKPLKSARLSEFCKSEYDAKFFEELSKNNRQLYDVVLAANYMDMKALLHTACATVACKIKGQPLEKIKDILAVSE